MNILITAGGTSEKMDEVRTISNMATGRLGSMIADVFLEKSDVSVTYVCPTNAVLPQNSRAEILFIDNVQALKLALENLLRERPFEAIVHSMAVSDYSVKYSVPSDRLAVYIAEFLQHNDQDKKDPEELSAQIHSAITTYNREFCSKKISSDIENLILCLQKTPKIIELFKKLQPDVILVGFKLLVEVEESQLLHAAEKLMDKNRCDFVLANDQKNIDENRHIGLLIGTDQSVVRLNTKSEIARTIVNRVIQKIEGNRQK